MDRDAVPDESVARVVPPSEWSFVRTTGLVGLWLVAGAALLGLLALAREQRPGVFFAARLVAFVFAGALVVGTTVWARSARPRAAGSAVAGGFPLNVVLVSSRFVAGMSGLAAVAMELPPGVIGTTRLWLVFVGALAAGSAVSMRPDLWQAWALGAATGLLAVFGTPEHWDSFKLLFGVFAAVALAWTVLLLVPRYRLPVLSAALVFHFTGIFFATTTPPPTPWVTEQVYSRVYNPYLQFIYMRNAYHFYSPEPGPASIIVCLLKTETGTDAQGRKQYDTRWVVLPKRPNDVKDPLGLTYYRRLSITEQLSRATPGLAQGSHVAERAELLPRRQAVAAYLIPTNPGEELVSQYRLPDPTITRIILPSYASHVILENTDRASAGKTTVKFYRLEHQTLNVDSFANPRNRPGAITSPYHPTTYRPYFLGEYGYVSDPDKPGSTRCALLHPQEPLLYWLVPIVLKPGFVGPDSRDFVDYLSIHALHNVIDTGERTDSGQPVEFGARHVDNPKYSDRVFNWNQLR